MAGSKRWFVYVADDATRHGILLDESNTEAINGAAAAPPTTNIPVYQVPKGMKAREIIYQSADGNRTIKCYALNTTVYNSIPTNFRTIPDPIAGGAAVLTFVRKNAEKVRLPNFGADTGLNDGDSPN